MSYDNVLKVFRKATEEAQLSDLIPIFIGSSVELQTVVSTDGTTAIPIPEPTSGLSYKEDSYEAQITYWKNCATYSVDDVSTDLLTLSVTTDVDNEPIDVSVYDYSCFITLISSNTLVDSCTVSSVEYSIVDSEKVVTSIILREAISSEIDIDGGLYSVTLARLAISDLTSSDYTVSDNVVTLSLTNYSLVDLVNLQALISVSSNFYYTVTDFRYYTVSYTDDIPTTLIVNKYNKLGIFLNQHRALSTNDAIFYTIPEDTIEYLSAVLQGIAESYETYGYYIVPTVYDRAVGALMKTWLTDRVNEQLYFMALISADLPPSDLIASGNIIYA